MQFRDYIAQRETILCDFYYGVGELIALARRDSEQAIVEMSTLDSRTRQRLGDLRDEMHRTCEPHDGGH